MKNVNARLVRVLFVAVFALAWSARADLLYFMTSSYNDEGDMDTYNFDYAMAGVAWDGNAAWGDNGSKVYLNIQATPDSGAASSQYLAATEDGPWYVLAGPAWADVSDYTSDEYTFYVETYKSGSANPIWGYDEETAQCYDDLLKNNHIYTDSTSLQTVTPWAIPEPSSGLLVLLGLAGLALKRRRGGEVEVRT